MQSIRDGLLSIITAVARSFHVFVCLSLCLFVTTMSPAKTAEPVGMPFALWTSGSQGSMY